MSNKFTKFFVVAIIVVSLGIVKQKSKNNMELSNNILHETTSEKHENGYLTFTTLRLCGELRTSVTYSIKNRFNVFYTVLCTV